MRASSELPRSPAIRTGWTLGALVIGLGSGVVVNRWAPGGGEDAAAMVEPVGRLWCAAMRLLAYPLVVCLLVTTFGGPAGALGRTAIRALAVFVAILIAGAGLALALAPGLLSLLNVRIGALAVAGGAPAIPARESSNGDWLSAVLGAPIDRALVSGNLLVIVVLSALLGIAVSRLREPARRTILDLARALLDLQFVVLGWLLAAAPVAILTLAFPMGLRAGVAGAGAFASYVTISIVLLLILTALLYPAVGLFGGVPVAAFARAAAPAQAVAVGTRSSLASLPALLEAGRVLGLPAAVNGLVSPLAVSVFKANRTVSGIVKFLFLARVYGLEPDAATTAVYVATTVLVSFSTPGIPNSGPMLSTPALLAAGIPMEGIAMTYAVDALPDIFKTLANVTADLAAACIVAARGGRRVAPS